MHPRGEDNKPVTEAIHFKAGAHVVDFVNKNKNKVPDPMYPSLSVGDPYKNPTKAGLRTFEKEPHTKPGCHDFPFKPAKEMTH